MTNLEQHKTLVMDLITQIACGTDHHELKPFTQAVFASMEKLSQPQKFSMQPTHFVSLSKDLLHVYLAFRAESEEAVRKHLERTYRPNGIWTLPWAFIYPSVPSVDETAIVIDRTFELLTESIF